MKRFWWNLRFAWYMNHWTGWHFAWISAQAWDQEDVDEMTPEEAVHEDFSNWDEWEPND